MSTAESRVEAGTLTAQSLPRPKSQLRELVEALLVALLLALGIRTFFVQAFKIPSGSMLPTLQIGDHILVNKFIYGARIEIPLTQMAVGHLPALRKPKPGDVIVFIYPKERDKDFIKRVIAVEGQTIEVRHRQVYIDGRPWDDPHANLTLPAQGGSGGENYGPYTVPRDTVFVMGDNRNNSYDSRFWGTVPIADIKGQAMIIYFSWDGPGDVVGAVAHGLERLGGAIVHHRWDAERWVRWDRIGRIVY